MFGPMIYPRRFQLIGGSKRPRVYLAGMLATALLMLAGCVNDTPFSPPLAPADDGVQRFEILNGQIPENGMVVVARVVSKQDGWVAIHRDNGKNAALTETCLGYTAILDGTTSDLRITLDSSVKDGERLWVMLHIDNALPGVYEFTGPGSPDQPVLSGTNLVSAPFTMSITTPAITAGNQMPSNNELVIANVAASENGWVVVQAIGDSGQPLSLLGYTRVEHGVSTNVKVKLDTSAASAVRDGREIKAVLHIDRGEESVFEFPGPDSPVRIADSTVYANFIVNGAPSPSIAAVDQPVINGDIIIPMVGSGTFGWVVIHEDNGSGPDLEESIGGTRIPLGTSTDVRVTLTKSTPIGTKLWATLHLDNGTIGEYDYSGSYGLDIPVLVGDRLVASSFVVR